MAVPVLVKCIASDDPRMAVLVEQASTSTGDGSTVDLSPLQAAINTNSADISTVQGALTTLQSTVTTQGATLNTLTASISTNTSSITALQSTVTTQGASITTLQGSVTSNASAITTLQNRATIDESDISNNTTNIATNTSKIGIVQGNVATLQSQMTSVQNNVSTLQQQMGDAQSDITSLDGAVSTLQTDVAALQALAQIGTATYVNAIDANLAGLKIEVLEGWYCDIFRGAGTLTTSFSPDVNAWYKLADQTTIPQLANYQGQTAVVQGTWLTSPMNSTILWTPVYVKYDATGIYCQMQTAPSGQYIAFEIVALLGTT